jgi:nitrile hydratase beta subunit
MNGVHDMGGMAGFGPISPEADEPVFHEHWERRVLALTLAMGATGQWNIDASRHTRETLPPAQYLSSNYYQIWLAGLMTLLVRKALVSEAELQSGKSSSPPSPPITPLKAADVASALARGTPYARPSSAPARFRLGEHVRARNIHVASHTRLPRYVRGRTGEITRVHGTFVFPDSNAHFRGEDPQWLYTVAFTAAELWGETDNAIVNLDLWEPYLEGA